MVCLLWLRSMEDGMGSAGQGIQAGFKGAYLHPELGMFVTHLFLELLQAAHDIIKHDKDAGEAEKGEDHIRHIARDSPH